MPGAIGYTSKRKEEFRKMIDTGEIETWYRFYAVSNGGTYFHVEVPERDIAKAPKLLEERAKQLDAI